MPCRLNKWGENGPRRVPNVGKGEKVPRGSENEKKETSRKKGLTRETVNKFVL